MNSPIETVFNRPLAIAALTLIGTVGGSWIKDRITQENTEAANAVRISHLEKRDGVATVSREEFEKLEKEAIRRDEFNAQMAAILRELQRISAKLDR